MLDPNYDPLFVVNPKHLCPECQNIRQKRGSCTFCKQSGFLPVNLSGMWYPTAGFLVCGGPSVNNLPVEKLRERGIVSFGVNNVAGHVPVDAWTFSDPQKKFHHGLFLDPKTITFSPIPKLKKHVRAKLPDNTFRIINRRVWDCPSTFGYERRTSFDPETFFTTTYGHWGMGGKQQNREFTCLCTMLLGIRLMHYLGCTRVYMIGVDFWMTEEAQYAFGQTKGVRNGRYSKENQMLEMLKPTFEKHSFQMFNCNPETKCDAVPFVPFEEAFEDCKGAIPKEPFDLSQWYDKGLCNEYEKKYPKPIPIEELQSIQKQNGDI